jgi:hypothetical protein
MGSTTFDFSVIRFEFEAESDIRFPAGRPENLLRGAFGAALYGSEAYARVFSPSGAGPSGLRNRPRPYVFRGAHLEGKHLSPGERFEFDMHWFAAQEPPVESFALRGVRLVSRTARPVSVSLEPPQTTVRRMIVWFLTPTELKGGGEEPEFRTLFARARDRVSTLRALYGPGPLEIDFRSLGERAARVAMVHCDLQHHAAERRSRGTGQTHPLKGFTGEAEYEGDLTEFLPCLEAAKWTGIGRQTSWGKGAIDVEFYCNCANCLSR